MSDQDDPIEYPVALDTMHKRCHEAADAFWTYWNANGETHKHGYYESTWGAINRALRLVGTRYHDYGTAARADAAIAKAAGVAAAPPTARTPEPDKQDQGVERAALREALEELVAIHDLKRSHAQASYHAANFPTQENYSVIDSLSTEIGRRQPLAWLAARAALAAHPGVV